jgi:catechol 2,3-dioxygenase-like lactoylglutathione lyase family enzyme
LLPHDGLVAYDLGEHPRQNGRARNRGAVEEERDVMKRNNQGDEEMAKTFDPKVFQLGYVALQCADLEKTRDHYLNMIGMTETAKGDGRESFLSVGYEHHNIVLKKADSKSLLHLGYQLKPAIEIEDFGRDLQKLGLKPLIKSDSQPGVAKLVECEVVPGNVFQFYSHIDASAPGFKNSGVAPLRLGHVAIISSEADKLIEFYRDFLGFWKTDDIGGLATFMTCNRDHHVVNIVGVPESRVHHIAFELKDNSCHPMASDLLRRAGVKIQWGPSRHTAGHNLAGYHFDPEKVLLELYTEMDVFIPELGMCEARPWHEHFPMKPRTWGFDELNAWGADFAFNLAAA